MSAGIAVENPATGAVIRTVPSLDAEEVRALVARARAAQPAWEALGFEGRARVLRRAQKWVLDNGDRLVATIVSETGKTHEDAQLAELSYAASAFGFWAKHAAGYLADERVRTGNPFVAGRKLVVRYAPVGVVGVIGPWNYPLTNSFGDCIPAMAAGNSRRAQALRGDAADLAADGRVHARVRAARRRLPGRHGRGGDRRRAGRRGRHGDVHRLHRDRAQGARAGRADAHAGVAGAGRQGPDDRARRRRPRARRQRRRLLLDAERRPDLHLDRARVRRGAGLRRVRAQGLRQGARAAPGPAGGSRERGRGRDDVPAPDRDRHPPRRRGAPRRRERDRRRPRRTAASSSRRCSRASTTRWRA